MELESLYQAIIHEHFRRPLHAGLREPFDAEVHHVNPVGDDEVTVRVTLSDADSGPVLADVSYQALGCSIHQASTSIMADLIIGKTVSEAMDICRAFLDLMQSRCNTESEEDMLGNAVALTGVSKYPARIKCALLGWMAWKEATTLALSQHGETAPAPNRAAGVIAADSVETAALGGHAGRRFYVHIRSLGFLVAAHPSFFREMAYALALSGASLALDQMVQDWTTFSRSETEPDLGKGAELLHGRAADALRTAFQVIVQLVPPRVGATELLLGPTGQINAWGYEVAYLCYATDADAAAIMHAERPAACQTCAARPGVPRAWTQPWR